MVSPGVLLLAVLPRAPKLPVDENQMSWHVEYSEPRVAVLLAPSDSLVRKFIFLILSEFSAKVHLWVVCVQSIISKKLVVYIVFHILLSDLAFMHDFLWRTPWNLDAHVG